MATAKKKEASPTKGKGTGYRAKTSISLREAEGWSAEPETERRVVELAKMIIEGNSRETVQSYAREHFKVGDRQVRAYYNAAVKYLTPADDEKFRKELINSNLARLETIVERCMKGNDYKNAIAAIKEINSVVNPNKNEIKIGKQGDTEIIQISFD